MHSAEATCARRSSEASRCERSPPAHDTDTCVAITYAIASSITAVSWRSERILGSEFSQQAPHRVQAEDIAEAVVGVFKADTGGKTIQDCRVALQRKPSLAHDVCSKQQGFSSNLTQGQIVAGFTKQCQRSLRSATECRRAMYIRVLATLLWLRGYVREAVLASVLQPSTSSRCRF